MRRFNKGTLVWKLLGLAGFAAVIAIGAGLASNEGTRAAAKYSANAGGGQSGISVEAFMPDDIFIHAGDTIEWTNPYEEIHTVTFAGDGEAPAFVIPAGPPPDDGPPKLIVNPEVSNPTDTGTYDGVFANSGILFKGDTFSLTFAEQGTFAFLCVIHPGMVGTVHVVDDGVTVPSQDQLDREAAADLEDYLADGEASSAALTTGSSDNDDGSTTWTVGVPQSVGLVDVMRYVPASLDVAVGDTVTWSNNTFVPHTVTYTAGEDVPAFVTPEFADAGPPTLVLAPSVLFPVNASQAFSGDAYVNSGFTGIGPEATAPPDFSLTFDKAGSYLFICVLHADQGMATVVNVGGGTVTPPSTGDAGLQESSENGGSLWFLALTAATAVVSLATFRTFATARR